MPIYRIIGIITLTLSLYGTHSFAGVDEANSQCDAHNDTAKDSHLLSLDGSGWVVGFDNDILVPGGRDQDYTYGINTTFIGSHAREHWLSSHEGLDRIDRLLGLDEVIHQGYEKHSIEYGLFGFTPEDITQAAPTPQDRPYASLVYTSSKKERMNLRQDRAIHSSLTLGFLGLDVVGELQSGLHELISNDLPQGWDNQISDGGEPTFKYNLARQLLEYDSHNFELKQTQQVSVGYITEASWGMGIRYGKISTPWLSFNPELAYYGENATPQRHTAQSEERYLWAGFAVKGRAYNAFLQGQFKDNPHEFAFDELNHVIVEAWLGYTQTLPKGFNMSYYVRGHTNEVKEGIGSRDLLWGGLLLSRYIDAG